MHVALLTYLPTGETNTDRTAAYDAEITIISKLVTFKNKDMRKSWRGREYALLKNCRARNH